jgi:ribosomal protein S18 acetylase RimI-like enzyme
MAHSIRFAAPDDAPALAALAEATFIETFGPDGFAIPYPADDLADFLRASYAPERVAAWIADPAETVWVAEDAGGVLVAYAEVGPNTLPHPEAKPGEGELKRIYVRRSAQGTGLGRALLELSLQRLDPRGEARIWLGVWSGNLKAQRLYARYGFAKAGEYEFRVGRTRDREFILRRG